MKAYIILQKRTQHAMGGLYIRIFVCSLLFSVFFLENSALYAQKRFLLSPGISLNWSMGDSKFDTEGQDNVVSEGSHGFIGSLGVFWFANDPEFDVASRITFENYKSKLQNWERIPIGSMTANVFRIDPIVFQYRINGSKWICNFNLAGFSVFTGKSVLFPNSYCYDNGSWYLIRNMHINKSIGWSLIGVGFDYEFTPWISAGIETLIMEEDRINVTFLTDNGDIKSKVSSANLFFPVKFRLTIKL